MSKNKFCPLLTIGLPRPGTNPAEPAYCTEDNCAWWIDEYVMPANGKNILIPGKCAIREIGASIESIRLDGIPQ